MRFLSRSLRLLGNYGAMENARRSCDEHRVTVLRVDALGHRLAALAPAPKAGPRAAVRTVQSA